MKIDHIFIVSTEPDRDAKLLTDFGLTEGPPNNHPGQGTADRRFFFDNVYIEFLYIDHLQNVQSDATKPIKMYERISLSGGSSNISPFGFGMCQSDNGLEFTDYKTWEYKPLFLPPPLKMNVFGDALVEPMYYQINFLSEETNIDQKKFKHKNKLSFISSVKLHTPENSLNSKLKKDLNDNKIVEFLPSETHFLELEFDNGDEQKSHDFRPTLPLIFNW